MKRASFVCGAIALCLLSLTSSASADIWLDLVVEFDRPTGSSTAGGPATNALGANDGAYVSIDIPETLILAFTDNTAMDGTGADLYGYEVANGDSSADLYGSADNVTYVFLGRPNGNFSYDLASYPTLPYVNYLKFVGLDNGGGSAGYDLDAVKALNSGPYIPEPATLSLLALGALGILRRRRAA